jgi:hypothetical protein
MDPSKLVWLISWDLINGQLEQDLAERGLMLLGVEVNGPEITIRTHTKNFKLTVTEVG